MIAPHLATRRLTLRLAQLGELDTVTRYWRENGARYDPPLPAGLLNGEFFHERILVNHKDCLEGSAYRLYLFRGSEIVGTLELSEVVRGFRHKATLGYAIAGNLEGQGYMSEAVRAAIDFSFRSLNLHRIEASYSVGNERSSRLLSRLGFVTEGTLRQFHYNGQQWLDQVATSLINRDWVPPASE